MASAQALNLLFPCLDFRRELPMEYSFEDMAPVKVHPECVFMATANVGSQYTGTHKVDRALLDRFNPIELDTLTSEKATDILKKAFTNVSAEDLANIVSIYTRLQKAHDDFKISFSLSFRHLKEVTEMVNDGFTIYDSYYALCRGVGGMDGLKAIKEFVKTK